MVDQNQSLSRKPWLHWPSVTIYLLLFGIGLFVGAIQVDVLTGVPSHGRYHPSDMDDLQQQLLGYSIRPAVYAAGPDHPAWLMICGVYQKVSMAFGLSGMRLWNAMMPVMLGFNLCLFLTLTRRLGFTLFQGTSLTAVFIATGATITWSVVLETHVLAPTSLLLAALILSSPRLMLRVWNRPSVVDLGIFGFAIALSASITITNVMLGILSVLHARSIRRPQPLFFIKRTVRRFPTLLTGGLIAVGILAFVNLAGWYLWKDPEMRQFLEIFKERHLIAFMDGAWWDSVLALAWIAPPMSEYSGTPPETMMALKRNWTTAPAYISGLVVLILTLCSLRVTPSRAMFIPAFALFAIALHSIYGRGESFLYSANYTWATVIAIGLLGRAVGPRFLAPIALVIALMLFIANWAIWSTGVQWIINNDFILRDP
jgi:hypothetical protein